MWHWSCPAATVVDAQGGAIPAAHVPWMRVRPIRRSDRPGSAADIRKDPQDATLVVK